MLSADLGFWKFVTEGLWVSESHRRSGIPWPPMKCSEKAVVAGDTFHEGVVYMTVLHQAMALHSVSLFQSRSNPPPPATGYSFIALESML